MIITTPDFWDCECEENYIHPTYILYCIFCGANQFDQPNSRVNEVEKYIDAYAISSQALHLCNGYLQDRSDMLDEVHKNPLRRIWWGLTGLTESTISSMERVADIARCINFDISMGE